MVYSYLLYSVFNVRSTSRSKGGILEGVVPRERERGPFLTETNGFHFTLGIPLLPRSPTDSPAWFTGLQCGNPWFMAAEWRAREWCASIPGPWAVSTLLTKLFGYYHMHISFIHIHTYTIYSFQLCTFFFVIYK